MAIEIKTKHIIALCATKDSHDQIKILDEGGKFGGVHIKVEHSLVAHQQIQDELAKRTGAKANQVILVESLTPTISYEKNENTLVLVIIPPLAGISSENWALLPDIIKRLPADKSRVPYIKALQILAGGLETDSTAVQLSKQLLENLSQNQPKS